MQAPRGHARDLKPLTCPLPWHTASARQTRAAAGGGGGRGGRTLRETSVRTARRKVTRPETGSADGTESAHRDRSAWGRGDPTSDVRRAGGMGGERPGTGHAGATRPGGVDGAGLGPGLGGWTQPRQPPTPGGCAPSSPASEPQSGCREPRPHGLRCSVIRSPHSRRLNPPVC